MACHVVVALAMVPNTVAAGLEGVTVYNIPPPPIANSELYDEIYVYEISKS